MAIKISIDKHNVCFPTKVLSGQVGRTLNMVVSEDTDNGTVCGLGDYVHFDQYKVADAPSDFRVKVLEQAADGNWYVQVTKVDINNPAILIYEVPEIAEHNYDSRFKAISNFYNKAGKTVRGYVLNVTDIYELSEDAFVDTKSLVAGATCKINGQKHEVTTE